MSSHIDLKAAQAYFRTHDPIMANLVGHAMNAEFPIAIPVAKQPKEYFASIVGSIVSQQISVKAADAVHARLVKAVGSITPESINRTDEDELRRCGLSRQKARYLKTNAGLWHTIPVQSFKRMDSEEVITELTKLYGIGRWTAEMFLMFSLARPDVFSYGDYGLMSALYTNYSVKKHWRRKIETIVDTWSPHRTVASLALWHSKDNAPVLL